MHGPPPACSAVCLGTLVVHEDRLALAGTVPDTADAVRVTTEARRVILHELEGPPVLDE